MAAVTTTPIRSERQTMSGAAARDDAAVEEQEGHCRPHAIVGMTNSEPDLMPVGQREVTVFVFV